ncbi:hypothetical protein HCA61_03760 [Rhodococcus sp. HNM0563]|uniref:hypothetical protein n=1 Tax=Rhodococcus sp. HNM0563 TaxID=2716339 RepID=UPI00146A9DCC|nr:hypothetical protein [Rhodococcus sp. HNM0563]NLU61376.1 hypothetical protein [Rhodococcus sp. HNM0563]
MTSDEYQRRLRREVSQSLSSTYGRNWQQMLRTAVDSVDSPLAELRRNLRTVRIPAMKAFEVAATNTSALEELRRQIAQVGNFDQYLVPSEGRSGGSALRDRLTQVSVPEACANSAFAQLDIRPDPAVTEAIRSIAETVIHATPTSALDQHLARLRESLAANQIQLAEFNGFELKDLDLQLPTDDVWDDIAARLSPIDLDDPEVEEAVDQLIDEVETLYGASPELDETRQRLQTRYGARACRLMLAAWFGGIWTYSYYLAALALPDSVLLAVGGTGIGALTLWQAGYKLGMWLFPDIPHTDSEQENN